MSQERRATLFLLLTTCIWGATFFSMQIAVRGISESPLAPLLFLAMRFTIAAAAFVLIVPRVVTRMNRRVWLQSFILGVAFYAGFVLQIWGLQGSTPTIVAFLTNLTVVFTPVLGRLFFGERFTMPVLIGAVVALAGVYVLTDPAGGGFRRAEVSAFLCAIAFAFQIQLTNVYTARSDPEGITFGMFAWAVLFSIAGLLLFPDGRAMLAPSFVASVLALPAVLASVLFNALVASVVAIWVMNRFQRDVPPTRAAVLYTLEPVFAAVFSALFIHEAMTPQKVVGGAIIVGGNLLCEILRRRRATPA